MAWRGAARPGAARLGVAGMVGRGMAWRGWARQGVAGAAIRAKPGRFISAGLFYFEKMKLCFGLHPKNPPIFAL